MGKKHEYIVYDTKTDLPVCMGTAIECAEALGITHSALEALKVYLITTLEKVLNMKYLI